MARKKKEVSLKTAPEAQDKPSELESPGIRLNNGQTEGLSVLVELMEKVNIEQDHDTNIDSISFKGTLAVENPSPRDRVWDISFELNNIESTDLEPKFEIRELGTEENDKKYSQDFQIIGEKKSLLLVKEYINSSPAADEILNLKDIETHLLSLKDNISEVEAVIIEDVEEEKESSMSNFDTQDESVDELDNEDENNTFNDHVDQVDEDSPIIAETQDESAPVSQDLEDDDDDLDYMEEDEEKQEFESWTIDELLEYCEDNLLEVPENATKEEIIEVISEAEKEMYDGGVELEESSLESFGISLNTQNKVTFAIAAHNLFEKPINELSVTKEIPPDFENISIVQTSKGNAVLENEKLNWTVSALEPGETVILKFSAEIFVKTHDSVETGVVTVNFNASSSFTGGLEVNDFKGLTRNKSHVDMVEKDEEPDTWDCNMVFKNPSEFLLELVSVDVNDRDSPNVNLVEFPNDPLPLLPSGAEWHSQIWRYESEEYPVFEKKTNFRVMPDLKTSVLGTISIQEVELVLASITGTVLYEVEEKIPGIEEKENELYIPSYKDCDIKATLVVKNNGSAPLNELKIVQNKFTDDFLPPNTDEVKLLWDGNEIELSEESITIDNEQVQVYLKNLKDTPTEMFEPGSRIELQYPVHATHPPKETVFETDVVYVANTYPKGAELVYIPEPETVPILKVVHIRRKYRVGKEIVPVGTEGHYQIHLSYSNIGDMPLKDFVLLDKVPDNFSYGGFSTEPTEITDEIGTDTLKWKIESLIEGETLEISYEITGSGEYRVSDAQLSL